MVQKYDVQLWWNICFSFLFSRTSTSCETSSTCYAPQRRYKLFSAVQICTLIFLPKCAIILASRNFWILCYSEFMPYFYFSARVIRVTASLKGEFNGVIQTIVICVKWLVSGAGGLTILPWSSKEFVNQGTIDTFLDRGKIKSALQCHLPRIACKQVTWVVH